MYIYPLLGLPPAPSPPFWVITEPLTELPMLDSRFLLAICLTHGIDVSMSITVYQFSPNPTMSTHPLPTSAGLFLPCKWIHLYHFSRFHIHMLIYIFLWLTSLCMTCDPAIPLLGIYPEKTVIHEDTCTWTFTAALFTIGRTWKQPKCPLTDEQIKKMWYIYTMEYYSATKGTILDHL